MSEETSPAEELHCNQWWYASRQEAEPHQLLDKIVSQLEQDQASRYSSYREYERLFGATVTASGDDSYQAIATDDLTQNELQNTIETLWAQVFKNRIVPAVSVSEADWDEWSRARSYSRWTEGAFDEAGVYTKVFPKAGAYTLVHGTGLIRVGWKETGEKTAQVTAWPVNPRYFGVDRLEGKHGEPRSIFFKDHIDRYVLMETYRHDQEGFFGKSGDRLLGIKKCTSNDDPDLGVVNSSQCDMLTVREAFHLPSGPKAKDGRHVIWVKGCTLVDEEFTWDVFPLVVMKFGVPMEGFYGESAVKRLAPSQKNLDKLNKKIDKAQDVMGVPRIIVDRSANIVLEHIDDETGSILVADNINGIKDWNAQCASPELYNDRDTLGHKMRSLLGVSDFESQQQIPQGMRDVSGAFLERWVEQGQARHAMFHAEYENAVIALSKLFMRQGEDLQKRGYKLVVKGSSDHKTSIEMLDFKECMVDLKKLKVTVQAMSDLPQTFSGKVDAIGKLRTEGGVTLDPKTIMRMIEIPDVHGTTDMMVSDEEIIFKNLTHMCKTGKYIYPMPFDNLDLIVQMTVRYINMYRVRNDSDNEVVGLLAQYIDDAILLKKGLGATDPNAPPAMSTAAALSGMGPSPIDPATGMPMQPMGMPMGQPGMPMPDPMSGGMPPMAGPGMAPQGAAPPPMM